MLRCFRKPSTVCRLGSTIASLWLDKTPPTATSTYLFYSRVRHSYLKPPLKRCCVLPCVVGGAGVTWPSWRWQKKYKNPNEGEERRTWVISEVASFGWLLYKVERVRLNKREREVKKEGGRRGGTQIGFIFQPGLHEDELLLWPIITLGEER